MVMSFAIVGGVVLVVAAAVDGGSVTEVPTTTKL